jgi:hypothetical protein
VHWPWEENQVRSAAFQRGSDGAKALYYELLQELLPAALCSRLNWFLFSEETPVLAHTIQE